MPVTIEEIVVNACTLISDGEEVSRQYDVQAVVINKEINRISFASITLSSGDWEGDQRTPMAVSNGDLFVPGKSIEIKAASGTESQTLFKGIVVKHSLKIRASAPPMILVECRDVAFKMTLAAKSKYYKDVKDSDIMSELLDAHGVENTVDDSTVTHKEMVQYDCTDWDFILCRADANGMLVMPGDGSLKITKPDLQAEPVKTLRMGRDLVDLDAEIDARHQFKNVQAKTWSPADQGVTLADANDTDLPGGGNISLEDLQEVSGEDGYIINHSGFIDSAELQQWADAKMMKQRLAKIRGKAKLTGVSPVPVGSFVLLEDVGERFSGKVFVTGVRHQLDNINGWRTYIQFGLDPAWFVQKYTVEQPKAGAMLPAIEGLQIGVVTQLENDPEGEDRIMVRLPIIDAAEEGIWCRVCTLDAGNNRGTFFRPEINDEVIVGFLNNDPRHAIVLGMCNSSSKPAPLVAADDNHQKGFVSRSNMKMLFDDDKKSIAFETPAGNKLTLTEDESGILLEDQNGNKITMDTTGITEESASDMKLKITSGKIEIMDAAGNQVKIEASGVTIQSAAKITISGSMVELTAGSLTVNAGMASFSGVVQATTFIASAGVVSPMYTPGAGNVM